MAAADPAATPGLVLSIVVIAIAVLLLVRQWMDWWNRSETLSEPDARYFAHQDVRRALGATAMILTALGLFVGTRINIVGASLETRRLFAGVWCAVILLVFVLLLLAWLDLRATRAYARRHQHVIADERRAFLDAERRRRAIPGNGRGGPSDLLDGPPIP
jgi:hypothetical protein